MLKHIYHTFIGYFSRREFTASGGYIDILKVAYPLVISCITFTIMMFCDRLMLAKYSISAVSAAFTAGILYFTLFCFFLVAGNFTSAIVAQYTGAKQPDNSVRAAWNGIYYSIAASVLIILLNPHIGHFILQKLFSQEPTLYGLASDYFDSIMFSGVFSVLSVPCYAYFNGQGRTAVAAVVNTAACVINIPLNYILIFGCEPLGIGEMGVRGAGFSTTLCNMLAASSFFIYFLLQNQKKYPTRKFPQFRWDFIKRLIRFGSPSGLQSTLDVGAYTLMMFLFAELGNVELGAAVIAFSINNIFFMPLTGFADATAIVCGQNIGARRLGAAEKSAYRSWRIALTYMTLSAILYITAPTLLVSIFAPTHEDPAIKFADVLEMTKFVFIMLAIFNIWDATKFILVGALRGAGDTKVAMLINAGGAWLILVPTMCIMVYYFRMSLQTIMIFLTIYGGIEALLMLWRFRSKAWKRIRVIDRQ